MNPYKPPLESKLDAKIDLQAKRAPTIPGKYVAITIVLLTLIVGAAPYVTFYMF